MWRCKSRVLVSRVYRPQMMCAPSRSASAGALAVHGEAALWRLDTNRRCHFPVYGCSLTASLTCFGRARSRWRVRPCCGTPPRTDRHGAPTQASGTAPMQPALTPTAPIRATGTTRTRLRAAPLRPQPPPYPQQVQLPQLCRPGGPRTDRLAAAAAVSTAATLALNQVIGRAATARRGPGAAALATAAAIVLHSRGSLRRCDLWLAKKAQHSAWFRLHHSVSHGSFLCPARRSHAGRQHLSPLLLHNKPARCL